MRTLHRIKRGNGPVPFITPQHREHLYVLTPRAGMYECPFPCGTPAQVGCHHGHPRGAMGGDRIVMGEPGTFHADPVGYISWIINANGEAPHHAPIRPASVMAPVNEPCSPVRWGAGTDQAEECRRCRAVPFRPLPGTGKKSRYDVGWLKTPACKKGFCDRTCLQGIIRVLAGLPEMAPSGPHICHPDFRLGRSFQGRTQRVPNCESSKQSPWVNVFSYKSHQKGISVVQKN